MKYAVQHELLAPTVAILGLTRMPLMFRYEYEKHVITDTDYEYEYAAGPGAVDLMPYCLAAVPDICQIQHGAYLAAREFVLGSAC
eukprot:scaffold89866_cov26-Prasinocladus_malaysianus.AAC.2